MLKKFYAAFMLRLDFKIELIIDYYVWGDFTQFYIFIMFYFVNYFKLERWHRNFLNKEMDF